MLGLIENYAVYCYHSNTKMKGTFFWYYFLAGPSNFLKYCAVLLAIEAEMDQEKMPKDEVVKGFLRVCWRAICPNQRIMF